MKITGVDIGTVELSNIPRSDYTFSDAVRERPKSDALTARLEEVNPLVEVDLRFGDLMRFGPADFAELLDVDVLIAGTDDRAVQARLNEEAVRRRIPAVFIGLHAGAAGGRIIWTIPGETGCYRCIAPERFDGDAAEQELHGERASLVDSLLVEVIAMKIVLAILERGQSSKMGRFFEHMAGRNEVVVRTDPEYRWGRELWDAALEDVPESAAAGLRELTCAGDALWLRTERDPKCPVCADGQGPA